MASGPCEVLDLAEEVQGTVKETGIQKELPKGDRQEDDTILAAKEEVKSTPNGIEAHKLHVVDQDLEEFVDSMADRTTPGPPEKVPGPEATPVPENAAPKLPRAEQVAERVLRAERVPERAPRVEKPLATEKVTEKVPRVEKAAKVEKAVRTEKPAEKPRPAASAAPKPAPVKRKAEGRVPGPAKDTLPWEGLTLNKCLLVASCLALLSVSCQVVQDVIEYGEEFLEAQLSVWNAPEDSAGEGDELWFYERWFDWSDEPPDVELDEEEEEIIEVEEEEELEEEEEEEEEPEEEDEEEVEPTEEEEEKEEEEEEPAKKTVAKVKSKRTSEKATKQEREKPSRGKGLRGRKAVEEQEEEEEEEEEETTDGVPKRRRREGKHEERRSRQSKHEQHPLGERKRVPKDGGEKRKGRPPAKPEQDLKVHQQGHSEKKPWLARRPFLPTQQERRSHRFGKRQD